ncbi:MAG: GAF domain-containing protein, partial [Planctomycetota bacterium]
MKQVKRYIGDLYERIASSCLPRHQKKALSKCITSIAEDVALHDINAVCDSLVRRGQALLKADCLCLAIIRQQELKAYPMACFAPSYGYRFSSSAEFEINELLDWESPSSRSKSPFIKTLHLSDSSQSEHVFNVGMKLSPICSSCTSAMIAEICGDDIERRGFLVAYAIEDFTSSDAIAIQLLAELACLVFNYQDQILALKDAMESIIVTPKWNDTLVATIKLVCNTLGYTSGIIYIPDEINETLRCEAVFLPHNHSVSASEFTYRLSDKALATHVFNSGRPHFSPCVNTDTFIDHRGREYFKIRGSLISVPIPGLKSVVGVLVVWSDNEQQPKEEDVVKIIPL